MNSYILWALLGMAGYSFMTLFVKIAERSSTVSTHMVLAVSTTIVAIFAVIIVAMRGELKALLFELDREPLLWAIAGGIALTVAVSSLFHALSLGPANVVVPIYGMFIVGGSLLGVLFLGEPMGWHKIVGLIAAVAGVVLISL
ncbi:MAG: EamA family transporter [Methyloceanibacter sp.]|jgi:transporter family protein